MKLIRLVFSYARFIKYKSLVSKNSKYKGRGVGKRVFIIGSGNSIKKLDLMKLKDENVIILNNGVAINSYDEIMSGSGVKIHLIAPIHLPQSDMEWISWFKRLEKEIPINVNVFFGLNEYKRNAKILIEENGLFPKHDLNWYFVGKIFLETGSIEKGLDLTSSIFAGEAASIYGLILAEYIGYEEIYLLGMDHDYFLYEDESEMRFYSKSEHQNNEIERGVGDSGDYIAHSYLANYKIFIKYKSFRNNFNAKIYSCSGPLLKTFAKLNYNDLFKL